MDTYLKLIPPMKRKPRRAIKTKKNLRFIQKPNGLDQLSNLVKNIASKAIYPQALTSALLCFWLIIIFTKIDPTIIRDIPFKNTYGPATFLSSLTVWIGLNIVTRNAHRSSLWSAAVFIALNFKIIGIGHLFNLVLLISLTATLDYYYSTGHKNWPTKD